MTRSRSIVLLCVAATRALAQGGVMLPIGQNLRDRPGQPGDVVLEINSAGTYALDGRPVTASQLVGQLTALLSRTRDHVVYIRADAGLSSSRFSPATIGGKPVRQIVQRRLAILCHSRGGGDGAGDIGCSFFSRRFIKRRSPTNECGAWRRPSASPTWS